MDEEVAPYHEKSKETANDRVVQHFVLNFEFGVVAKTAEIARVDLKPQDVVLTGADLRDDGLQTKIRISGEEETKRSSHILSKTVFLISDILALLFRDEFALLGRKRTHGCTRGKLSNARHGLSLNLTKAD
jgi:hypothetical protein